MPQKCKKLKVAIVTYGEMGHFIPLVKIAEILTEGGHDCHFITNGNKYIREKAPMLLDKVGIKEIVYTLDQIERDYVMM